MKIRRWITAVLCMAMMFLMMGSSSDNNKHTVSPTNPEARTSAAEIYESPGDNEASYDQSREYRYQEALSLFDDGFHADAVAIFLELADDVNAQFDLGLCYANGYGVEQNSAKADEWLEKAVEQGIDIYDIASMYQ